MNHHRHQSYAPSFIRSESNLFRSHPPPCSSSLRPTATPCSSSTSSSVRRSLSNCFRPHRPPSTSSSVHVVQVIQRIAQSNCINCSEQRIVCSMSKDYPFDTEKTTSKL
ncbi:unnamed protein product [Vicia faba]|uniref:Uncharacterized protein n=1 Tax=Vicia faba TaxID=3906 RepID=A0AAV0ZWT1_VICFA|nr:unnamed protein product [Vicia faba]